MEEERRLKRREDMAVTAEAAAEMVLERRAYARVGLLGNPSDVYGGRALSFAIADFSATVHLRPSPELLIQPHPHHDLVAFPSLPQLVSTALVPAPPFFNSYCLDPRITLATRSDSIISIPK